MFPWVTMDLHKVFRQISVTSGSRMNQHIYNILNYDSQHIHSIPVYDAPTNMETGSSDTRLKFLKTRTWLRIQVFSPYMLYKIHSMPASSIFWTLFLPTLFKTFLNLKWTLLIMPISFALQYTCITYLEALRIYSQLFWGMVIVENDSVNAISWMTSMERDHNNLTCY